MLMTELLFRRPDDTYVALVGGNPYHVTPGDPYWDEAVARAEMNGEPPLEPPPPAPPVVIPDISPRQLRLWLLSNGITTTQVENAIEAIPDPVQRAAAWIEWEYTTTFKRNHPLISQLGPAFGFSSAQMDQGFTEAAAL